MECGQWFHNGCVSDHNCLSDTDDDYASYADLDWRDFANNVAFPADEEQKVFAALRGYYL